MEDEVEWRWDQEQRVGEESKNFLVLSKVQAYGRYSFMRGGPMSKQNPKGPPPIYLKHKAIV